MISLQLCLSAILKWDETLSKKAKVYLCLMKNSTWTLDEVKEENMETFYTVWCSRSFAHFVIFCGTSVLRDAQSQSGGCRWRSSLWKLLWKELLAYTSLFLLISLVYRAVLKEEQQIACEKLIRWCRKQSTGENRLELKMNSFTSSWTESFKFLNPLLYDLPNSYCLCCQPGRPDVLTHCSSRVNEKYTVVWPVCAALVSTKIRNQSGDSQER